MEILIVICLLVVIALLLQDKIGPRKNKERKVFQEKVNPKLPDIMGQPRPVRSLLVPNPATESQIEETQDEEDNFESEARKRGLDIEIPQEELDEVFGVVNDLDNEEEEWQDYGEPNGEDGFASGVTFEELTTVGSLLQQEVLEPALQKQAVDIVHRIQGTELFSLLENSIENASQKIARLLDKSLSLQTDSSSSTMRKNNLEDFDIGEFV